MGVIHTVTIREKKKKTPEQRKKEVDNLLYDLKEGVVGSISSDQFKEYLKTVQKFHKYSSKNALLIRQQCPKASVVASYGTWTDLGYQVNKGEKGIKILCPIIKSEKDDETKFERNTLRGFRIGYVFDVSQTSPLEGKAKELTYSPQILQGDVSGYEKFLSALEAVAGCKVIYDHDCTVGRGYYNFVDDEIHIQRGMPQLQTVKTLAHELVHKSFHRVGGDKDSREIQAESVAYMICRHFGLPTDDYSFPYVTSYATNVDKFFMHLDEIRRMAGELIDKIERSFE